jgi:hypothetical protein
VLFSGPAPALLELSQADSLRTAFLRLVDSSNGGKPHER